MKEHIEFSACLLSMAIPLLGLLALTTAALAQPAPADDPAKRGPLVIGLGQSPDEHVDLWLESSLNRVYPASKPGASRTITVLAPRNGQVSFQACLRNERSSLLNVTCSVAGGDDLDVRVRRVGCVPLTRLTTDTPASELDGLAYTPGLVPDPLFPEQTAEVGPYSSLAFWITVRIPAGAPVGPRRLTVRWDFKQGDNHAELPATIDVSPFVVNPRKDFPVAHWFRGECLWDWYKTGMWEDEKLWRLHRTYMENLLSHGTDVIMTPIFFARRETFERPCQLLIVNEPEPGRYTFDFTLVKRYLDMAKDVGFERFEWSHLWIYWGVVNPIRVYTLKDGKYVMLWPPDTDGHGELYHSFLRQFLPAFHDFLIKENVLQRSYFHLSDEPAAEHIANYKKAREFLRQTAPWMKVMDALSDIEYGRQGLTDMPIPFIRSAQSYIDERIPHWVYYCGTPGGGYVERLMDTPLAKIRMHGFVLYKLGAKGFLHWGYNYWHVLEREQLLDPFTDATAGAYPMAPSGDAFFVYPGEDGPLDSIRWEVFAEALQDYAILQTAGIRPDDPMLSGIKTYADFPKTESWIRDSLARILRK